MNLVFIIFTVFFFSSLQTNNHPHFLCYQYNFSPLPLPLHPQIPLLSRLNFSFASVSISDFCVSCGTLRWLSLSNLTKPPFPLFNFLTLYTLYVALLPLELFSTIVYHYHCRFHCWPHAGIIYIFSFRLLLPTDRGRCKPLKSLSLYLSATWIQKTLHLKILLLLLKRDTNENKITFELLCLITPTNFPAYHCPHSNIHRSFQPHLNLLEHELAFWYRPAFTNFDRSLSGLDADCTAYSNMKLSIKHSYWY